MAERSVAKGDPEGPTTGRGRQRGGFCQESREVILLLASYSPATGRASGR